MGCAGCFPRASSSVEIFFSPQDACTQRMVEELNQARHSIDAAVYVFTSRHLAQALVEAQRRGVAVRVCLDGTDPLAPYSKRAFLEQHGIPVKLISGAGIMHHKFCIIDRAFVITGSFNWTTSAELRNDENVLFIRAPHVARGFQAEFERLWHGRKIDAFRYHDHSRGSRHPLPGAVTSVFFKDAQTGYIANAQSKRLHTAGCRWAHTITAANRITFARREDAIAEGHQPCQSCNP